MGERAGGDGMDTTLWNALVGVRIGLEEAVANHDMGAVENVLLDVQSLLDLYDAAKEAVDGDE